jgi:DedD protein
MAFFKFRLPGEAPSTEGAAPAPSESIDMVRRRARHRLIGAVVLVLGAVVGFPWLFDTQPRPVSVDTPIVVPDRQKTPLLSDSAPVPASQTPAKPLLPAQDAAVPTASSLDAREEVVPSTPAPALAKTQDKPAEKVADTPVEKPTPAAAGAKADAAPKPRNDGAKAQALLDGKPAKPVTGRVAIQVGAFTDAAKVREVRNKLEQAGLKTYTQVLEKDGKSTTRIRVGPFETKEDSDKAAARIRKLDLPVVMLKL